MEPWGTPALDGYSCQDFRSRFTQNLKKISSSGNKKTTKNTLNKNSRENSSAITMEKIEMLEQNFKQEVIQAIFEIGRWFWVYKNWHLNFDELAKKLTKPQFNITGSIQLTATSEQTFYIFIQL